MQSTTCRFCELGIIELPLSGPYSWVDTNDNTFCWERDEPSLGHTPVEAS